MKNWMPVLPMLALVGCFSNGAGTPYPLYSPADPPLPATEVATLGGPIESVDGVRVGTHGTTFALKPGCHEVVNQRSWGGSDNQSASIAHLPGLVFAVRMHAGYAYVLEIAGGTSGVAITMTERDPNGIVTQQFESGKPCTESE